MADTNRSVTLKHLREIREVADAAFWQVLDLRILLNKAEADVTATEVITGNACCGVLGDGEHYSDAAEECRPGDSPEQDQ